MKEEKRVFYLKVEISTLRLTPSTSILKQPIAETRPILKGNKKDPKSGSTVMKTVSTLKPCSAGHLNGGEKFWKSFCSS